MGFFLRTTGTRFLSAVAFPDRYFPLDFKFWRFQILWFGWLYVISWFGEATIGGGVVVCATGCGVHRDCLWVFCYGFSFHVVATSNSSVINPPSSGFLPDRRKVHGGWLRWLVQRLWDVYSRLLSVLCRFFTVVLCLFFQLCFVRRLPFICCQKLLFSWVSDRLCFRCFVYIINKCVFK